MNRSFYSTDLAYVHHVGFGAFAKHAAAGVVSMLRKAGIRRGTVVDLGCGSGIWLRELNRSGYRTIGVDASPAMLSLAKTVSPRSTLICSSLHTFELPPCEAVTALGEAAGYLQASACKPRSLKPLFSHVKKALTPGGLFIFDLITENADEAMDNRIWKEGKDWAVLTSIEEDRKKCLLTREITAFRMLNGSYRRSHERHRLGVYSSASVQKELIDYGFEVSLATKYGNERLLPRRLAFIGRKILK